jgi:hypothetical protein
VIAAADSVSATKVVGVYAVVKGATVVVVSKLTGVPTRSGTNVCVGPDAGGGTGRPFATVVVVAPFTVVVVRCVVVVVDGVGTVTGPLAVVVVVGGVVVVVGTSWARTWLSPVRPMNASAPTQTETTRRTHPS